MHVRNLILAASLMALDRGPALATFTPPNLAPGSQYQLIFVTNDSTYASNSDISYYNTFVTNEALQNTSLPATTWNAIGSTSAVAAVNNAPAYANVPVYNMLGKEVCDGNVNSLYSTISFDNFIYYDQFGNSHTSHTEWTGSTVSGQINSPYYLGSSNNFTMTGSDYNAGQWLDTNTVGFNGTPGFDGKQQLPLYALSAPITVPTPEPGTLALVGTGAAALVAYRWRRRMRR